MKREGQASRVATAALHLLDDLGTAVDQLVAGYTKETPTFGLRVFTRDANKLRQFAARGKRR